MDGSIDKGCVGTVLGSPLGADWISEGLTDGICVGPEEGIKDRYDDEFSDRTRVGVDEVIFVGDDDDVVVGSKLATSLGSDVRLGVDSTLGAPLGPGIGWSDCNVDGIVEGSEEGPDDGLKECNSDGFEEGKRLLDGKVLGWSLAVG